VGLSLLDAKALLGLPSRNGFLRTITALHHPTNHVVVTSLKRQVVRKKYAIDDVMKISYLSLLGVRNDPKHERTPCSIAPAIGGTLASH
jgi:hypothetical protein